ncbi:hypothetical protein Psi01_06380 [Planobispora siamensis]|uniref:Uncharacterized protein n=1 Tax=Planobispora siamensis TaxID=936338 RepID=A0A8J3S9Q3_9ACTN|nr:hypothetical protein Psi01_06380 [Planobispora siamensis]
MTSYTPIDDDLRAARERARRLDRLTAQHRAVSVQIEEAGRLVADLEARLVEEEGDVSRLEKGGFAAFLSGLAGSRQDRLDRERAEAEAVRERLRGQRTRLQWLQSDLAALRGGLAELENARQEFDILLGHKERLLVGSDDPRGRELVEIARRLADTAADLREHEEARQAGIAAGHAIGQVLRCLGGARGASTWDLIGGGTIADMMEHGHLRRADEAAWHAQQALDVFARELADIGTHVTPAMPEVDTRWFADTFFDNIITDAIKHQRIARTGEAVAEMGRWVGETVEGLASRAAELAVRRDRLVARREEILAG